PLPDLPVSLSARGRLESLLPAAASGAGHLFPQCLPDPTDPRPHLRRTEAICALPVGRVLLSPGHEGFRHRTDQEQSKARGENRPQVEPAATAERERRTGGLSETTISRPHQ